MMLGIVMAAAFGVAHAQLRRVKAELTPGVDSTHIQAGSTVRLSLKVLLPEGLHVQSDKPRDSSLIATVLTVTPPTGVTVGRIAYPAASELPQTGQAEALAVFGRQFAIGLDVKLAPDLKPGPLTIPGRLRYQACDDKMCFPPARVDTLWSLTVEQ